jgi:hypothetical protein
MGIASAPPHGLLKTCRSVSTKPAAAQPPHLADMALFAVMTGLRQANVKLGGWLTRAMVDRYAHIAPEGLQKASARLGNVPHGYVLATPKEERG